MTPDQETSNSPTDDPESRFTFVLHPDQDGIRSHAMRAHWTQRRHNLATRRESAASQQTRQLRPRRSSSTTEDPSLSRPQPQHGSSSESSDYVNFHVTSGAIPSQAITNMDQSLVCDRLDPFDMFPVKLTSEHHELLHHWLSTDAAVLSGNTPLSSFNPMRDVWIPLDSSNAASFNAIMAHSAAHLAQMRGQKPEGEALKFKTEALQIISMWMSEPETALGDDVLAAVLRLMTYEHFWGAEEEWRLHRNGLNSIIQARGGIVAVQKNWRLGLVVLLTSLRAKPTWFDYTNQIPQLLDARELISVFGNDQNIYRLRFLWLVSLIQDCRKLLDRHPDLSGYAAICDAINLVHLHSEQAFDGCNPADIDGAVFMQQKMYREACLFLFAICIQASASSFSKTASMPFEQNRLDSLNAYMYETGPNWEGSVERLYQTLFCQVSEYLNHRSEAEYATHTTMLLGLLSNDTRHGVERCLLSILMQGRGMGQEELSSHVWTPDFLLLSLREL
ncbi:tachykinin family protein [Dactylonectria macrodidyma]|uniref:Tachykinin family protein n=1 Tax=Dactylonectria macrodidyma TaxID=307937 RepID=A0A9P9FV54_9HYPO|nr:tachykinin family protein [Dactylonectria macrodidyma]